MQDQQKSLRKSPAPTNIPTSNPLASRPFAPQPKPETIVPSAEFGGYESRLMEFAILNPDPDQAQPLQPKLMIGAPGDRYEQEADRVAAQVVQRLSVTNLGRSQSDPTLQRETLPDEDEKLQMKPILQREALPDEDEELQMKPLTQRQPDGPASAATTELEQTIQTLRGRGQPLADSIRQPMEQAFGGADFSQVTIHTDTRSDQLNRSIQARAFTTKNDIFFSQGAYQPNNRSGKELIAHELTHVVQQSRAKAPEWQIRRKEKGLTLENSSTYFNDDHIDELLGVMGGGVNNVFKIRYKLKIMSINGQDFVDDLSSNASEYFTGFFKPDLSNIQPDEVGGYGGIVSGIPDELGKSKANNRALAAYEIDKILGAGLIGATFKAQHNMKNLVEKAKQLSNLDQGRKNNLEITFESCQDTPQPGIVSIDTGGEEVKKLLPGEKADKSNDYTQKMYGPLSNDPINTDEQKRLEPNKNLPASVRKDLSNLYLLDALLGMTDRSQQNYHIKYEQQKPVGVIAIDNDDILGQHYKGLGYGVRKVDSQTVFDKFQEVEDEIKYFDEKIATSSKEKKEAEKSRQASVKLKEKLEPLVKILEQNTQDISRPIMHDLIKSRVDTQVVRGMAPQNLPEIDKTFADKLLNNLSRDKNDPDFNQPTFTEFKILNVMNILGLNQLDEAKAMSERIKSLSRFLRSNEAKKRMVSDWK